MQFALVVDNYDKAIDFYVNKLHFDLLEDTQLSPTKRWVIISPKGNTGSNILLAQASNEEQKTRIGNQAGGRVFLFLQTDNLERDIENLHHHNVKIVRQPVQEAWGQVLVFEDIFGNLWDLIQPL
jgi:uncharacterized glyoxalase superfamily protein PhnB